MTFKERLQKEYPDMTEEEVEECVRDTCPDHHGFVDRVACSKDVKCVDCWDCIVPEKEEIKMNREKKVTETCNKFINEIKAIMNEPENNDDKCRLFELKPGDKFTNELGTFIVLSRYFDLIKKVEYAKVIQENFFCEENQFDKESCNYIESDLKKMFDEEIAPKYEKVFGDNLIEHEVDLKSVDMQDYGTFKCKVRPITFDEARKFNPYIVNKNLDNCWWTCTPWSMEERGWKYSVSVVYPSGYVFNDFFGNRYGVRPVCILKSDITVRKEKKDDRI